MRYTQEFGAAEVKDRRRDIKYIYRYGLVILALQTRVNYDVYVINHPISIKLLL